MEGQSIIVVIFCLLVWAFILVEIIAAGAKTNRRVKDDEIKIKLLAKIGEKLGVSGDDIHDIIHAEANKLKNHGK